jgi:hypothetical protein
MMKRNRWVLAALIVGCLSLGAGSGLAAEEWAAGPGGPPYPNDAGPDRIDVSGYPAEVRSDYAVFARRCSQCHTLARAINSQNLQLTPADQKAERASEPEIFTDEKIWRITDGVWIQYVGSMHAKPGAGFRIRPTEFEKIVDFLAADSKARKMGAHRASWRAARQKLLDDFQKSYPARYEALFGKN